MINLKNVDRSFIWVEWFKWSNFNFSDSGTSQTWFCSVSSPCINRQSIEGILSSCIELKRSYCENLKSLPALSCSICKVILKFSSVRLSLSGCSALPGYRQFITGLSIYHRDMTYYLEGLFLKKLRSACSCNAAFWDKIFIFHLGQRSPALRTVMIHSVRSIALLLASFDIALPIEREKPSWITRTIRIPPPRVEFCSVSSMLSGCVSEWAITQPILRGDPWHHIDQLCIRALTLRRAFAGIAAATCCARQHTRCRWSLNILKVRKPIGLSLRSRPGAGCSY